MEKRACVFHFLKDLIFPIDHLTVGLQEYDTKTCS